MWYMCNMKICHILKFCLDTLITFWFPVFFSFFCEFLLTWGHLEFYIIVSVHHATNRNTMDCVIYLQIQVYEYHYIPGTKITFRVFPGFQSTRNYPCRWQESIIFRWTCHADICLKSLANRCAAQIFSWGFYFVLCFCISNVLFYFHPPLLGFPTCTKCKYVILEWIWS